MKKFLCVLLTAVMLLSLANAAAFAEKETFSVAMVTDVGGINDQSFNALAWAGLQKAQAELGIEVAYLESVTEADYGPNLETLYDEGHDLIICVGYMMADAVLEAANAHPEQLYAIIDSNATAENIIGVNFAVEQCSYLVGVAAAKTTKTNNVGFVIGMAAPNMHPFGYGYYAGVKDTNSEIVIQLYNANSFVDAAGGKAAAISMFAQGADIVYHAAGGTGVGVIEAAKEQGKLAIGVDQDQSYLAPEAVLTSAMKRVDGGVFSLCSGLVEGTLVGGTDVYYTMHDGAVGIAPTVTLLSEEALNAVKAAEEAILAGTIVVPATQEAFDAAYGADSYTLDD